MLAPTSERRLFRDRAYWRRLFVLSLLTAGAVWFGRGWWLPAVAPPRPSDDPSRHLQVVGRLDFGEAWESVEHSMEVTLRNTGHVALPIREFDTSCDCARVVEKELTIPPGEERSVTLKLDLTRNKPAIASWASWPVRYRLRAAWTGADGQRRVSSWQIHGTAKAVLKVESASIWAGDDLVRGQAGESRSILISPLLPKHTVTLREEPDGLHCRLEQVVEGYRLHVSPGTGLPVGFFSKDVVLAVECPSSRPLPNQVVTVFGTVNDAVIAIPGSLSLGVVPVDSAVEHCVTLHHRRGAAFELAEIERPAAMTVVSRQYHDGIWRIALSQRVTASGTCSASLKFRVRLASGETMTVPVSLTWFGGTGAD
jgi:hypothetical protein